MYYTNMTYGCNTVSISDQSLLNHISGWYRCKLMLKNIKSLWSYWKHTNFITIFMWVLFLIFIILIDRRRSEEPFIWHISSIFPMNAFTVSFILQSCGQFFLYFVLLKTSINEWTVCFSNNHSSASWLNVNRLLDHFICEY